MPAPAGNLNAEKWTIDHTQDLLNRLEALIGDDHVHYLGQALGMCNAYAELWSRLKRKWKGEDEIIHRMKVIEQRFEARIVVGHMCGRYTGSSVRLLLRHYHGYETVADRSDRKRREVTEEMIDEIEAETGPLAESMKHDPEKQQRLLDVHGMTLEEMEERGYWIQDGIIYSPSQPFMQIDGKMVPL